MYEVQFPINLLQAYIECFWFLQIDLAAPAQLEERIFTDARADIVFTFQSPYLRRQAGQAGQPQVMRVSNLDAQRPYPVQIIQQGQIHLVGIRFRPGGLAAFFPMPMSELNGLTLPWRDVLGQQGTDLEEQLFEAAGQRQRQLALLNGFFMRRLNLPAAQERVAPIAAAIERSGGKLTIKALSRECGYSIRTLDRLFQQVLGMSPKFYARLVRFRQTLNCLIHQPATAWADIVSTFGYYDHPHFTKEFGEFTGTSPEAYRAELQQAGVPSAPNYVQFLQDNSEHLC